MLQIVISNAHGHAVTWQLDSASRCGKGAVLIITGDLNQLNCTRFEIDFRCYKLS